MIKIKDQNNTKNDSDIVGHYCDNAKFFNSHFLDDSNALESLIERHKNDVDQLSFIHAFDSNPFEALKSLNIDDSFFKKSTYECPFNGYTHYAILPVLVISQNFRENYPEFCEKVSWQIDYLLDTEFYLHRLNAYLSKDDEEIDVENINTELLIDYLSEQALSSFNNSISSILQGSGYTDDCYPNDGGCSKNINAVELDNGDILIVSVFNWSNK